MFDSSKERAIWQRDLPLPLHVETLTQSVEELFSLKSDHVAQLQLQNDDQSKKKDKKVSTQSQNNTNLILWIFLGLFAKQ